MRTRRVTRYIADCGRGFWNKNSCAEHEVNCKCWTNPKYRTCKTCEYGKTITDSNGMDGDPQYLQTWRETVCDNESFVYKDHFTAPDLCINCQVWVQKAICHEINDGRGRVKKCLAE